MKKINHRLDPEFPTWELSARELSHLSPELLDVPHPPSRLYIQGREEALDLLKKLPERGLSIVGTRTPQGKSLGLIQKEIPALTSFPLVIVSGFARGVDTQAHETALEHQLPTIAILGTGIDQDYPKPNRSLRLKILKASGLMISEYAPGQPGLGHQFLLRNRLIAGWSKATLMVQAGFRSGALNTASWCRQMNRTCYAVPCFPGDPFLGGNQVLLDRDHAEPFWGIHSLGSSWLELATQSTHPASASA
ncbi:MAG: DNA-processing protein DprA [Bdellovibrionia bacterium]